MNTSPWSDGYVTDIDYEYSYFQHLVPSFLDLVCMQMGRRPPAVGRPFRYLEIGCGLGLNSMVMAATNPTGRFLAADISPNHVATAQHLASQAGIDNCEFVEASFEELAAMELQPFDYIGVHGVWSWVSDQGRQEIVEVLRTHLATTGVVYLSYNCAVGWERRRSLARLFKELVGASAGNTDQRIQQAVAALEGLVEQGEGHFRDNELARDWLKTVKASTPQYLAHEYLNDHWTPFFQPDVAAAMAGAKLSYVGSADLMRNFDPYALKSASLELSQKLGSPRVTELLKDMGANWGMKRDIYGRGAARWTREEAMELFSKQRFVLTLAREKLTPEVMTPVGTSNIDPDLFASVTDAMAERPHSLSELLMLAGPRRYAFMDVLVTCSILVQGGMAAPLPLRDSDGAGVSAERLNRLIVEQTHCGERIPLLAAPATGSALGMGDLERCCYGYVRNNPDLDPAGLARCLLEGLAEKGRAPLHKGERMNDDQVLGMATTVLKEHVPVWRRLGIL